MHYQEIPPLERYGVEIATDHSGPRRPLKPCGCHRPRPPKDLPGLVILCRTCWDMVPRVTRTVRPSTYPTDRHPVYYCLFHGYVEDNDEGVLKITPEELAEITAQEFRNLTRGGHHA